MCYYIISGVQFNCKVTDFESDLQKLFWLNSFSSYSSDWLDILKLFFFLLLNNAYYS